MKLQALKTAIVLPLEAFKKFDIDELSTERLTDMINTRSHNTIIVTADEIEDLYLLTENAISEKYRRFDKCVNRTIAKMQGANEPMDFCNAFVSNLESDGRILIAKDKPPLGLLAGHLPNRLSRAGSDPMRLGGGPIKIGRAHV